ncbi:MAG: hypothetical protein AAF390_11190 [Pseudomonadota bacterium]
MTASRTLLSTLLGLGLAMAAGPAIAQDTRTTTVQAEAPAMTSRMRLRDGRIVPETGRCRIACGERAAGRRGFYTMKMPCPAGLTITPFGTCVRLN